jgi:hypothetical protein
MLTPSVIMQSVLLSVTNKSIMLNVIMLSVIMLSVVAPAHVCMEKCFYVTKWTILNLPSYQPAFTLIKIDVLK